MNTASRREFLKQAGTFGACMCCLGAISLLDSCAASKNIAGTETSEVISFPASSFADKEYITIQAKKFEEPIFVSKQSDGSYVALRMLCTHKGCTIVIPQDKPGKLLCPCHNSEFSTLGIVLKGPAIMPLQSFNVTTESQLVIVHFN